MCLYFLKNYITELGFSPKVLWHEIIKIFYSFKWQEVDRPIIKMPQFYKLFILLEKKFWYLPSGFNVFYWCKNTDRASLFLSHKFSEKLYQSTHKSGQYIHSRE